MSNLMHAVTMNNGDIYGVPAELIADHYAKWYAKWGEDYKENFNIMMDYFHHGDFEFADWAKNNMDWDDVKEHAKLLMKAPQEIDFQDGWVNGAYEYRHC